MQRQHSSQATSTLGNTPNLNIGFLHQKENPTHRLQGELYGSWIARVFFCLLDITSSKAALEQSSRAWL